MFPFPNLDIVGRYDHAVGESLFPGQSPRAHESNHGIGIFTVRFCIPSHLAPRDPLTFVGAAAVLTVIGAVAGWLPAHRATRIEHAEILREE